MNPWFHVEDEDEDEGGWSVLTQQLQLCLLQQQQRQQQRLRLLPALSSLQASAVSILGLKLISSFSPERRAYLPVSNRGTHICYVSLFLRSFRWLFTRNEDPSGETAARL